MRDSNDGTFSRRHFLRFSAVALASGAVLPLLNACSSTATPTTSPATPASPGTQASSATSTSSAPTPAGTAAQTTPATRSATIGFATTTASSSEEELWNKIAETFTEKNPGQQVNIELVPGSNWEKLRIMVQSDTAKDVMNVSDDDAYLMGSSGKFVTIDDMLGTLDTSVLASASWETFKVKDQAYFISPVFRTTIAIYNKALFDEAGITNVPTSWEEAWDWDTFVENMKALTKDANNDGQPEQYGFGGNYSLAVLWPFSNGGEGPYNATQTECRMDAPEIIEMYQSFSDLIHKEKVMAPNLENKDLFALFNAGKLAMMYTSGAESSTVTKDVNWDVLPLPKMKQSSITENFGRPFGVYSGSKEQDVALNFLAFLLSEDAQRLMVDFDYGNPVHQSAAQYFATKEGNPATKQLYFEGLKRDVDLQNVNPLGEEWVEVFIRRGAREILSGQNEAEPYLKERTQQMNEFIKKVGWSKA